MARQRYSSIDVSGRGVNPHPSGEYLADGSFADYPRQVNVRATEIDFHHDLNEIQHDTRIGNRSDAIRYAVKREATRIRRRRSTK